MVLTIKDMNYSAGQQLKIGGKVKSGCEFFSINIGHDVDNIALHFNPRFKYNKDRKTIVCNSKKGGWAKEQKESSFPFKHDEEFKLTFSFTNDNFNIKLPDGKTINFPNRFGDDKFDHLHVMGDVKIHSIKID